MKRPQWLPAKRDLSGILLGLIIGLLAYLLKHFILPKHPLFTDVFVALILGIIVLNTPITRLIRFSTNTQAREPDRYANGLRFTGKWILRLSIIFMGLEVEPKMLTSEHLMYVGFILLITVPTTFWWSHTLGAWFQVRRPLTDLIAAGTMICGASAVNAAQPVVGARREEQGIALSSIFFMSVVAFFLFRPVAEWMNLPLALRGLWSGLAVNDLSSAIAVGAQMGPGGDMIAAAAKSTRILCLAPMLIGLSYLRKVETRVQEGKVEKIQWTEHLPRFVLGYIAFAFIRAIGDDLATAHFSNFTTVWNGALTFFSTINDFLVLTVVASIGLHIHIKTLIKNAGSSLLVAAFASLWISGLSLLLLYTIHNRPNTAYWLGGVFLALSYLAYKNTNSEERYKQSIINRFKRGQSISLREAIVLLPQLEKLGWINKDNRQNSVQFTRLMTQLEPTIGELIPIRESPLPHGEGCRWITFWEGTQSAWALVAMARCPGATTPIHTHSHELIGKTLEGKLEEARFQEIRSGTYELIDRKILEPNELVFLNDPTQFHALRTVGSNDAIDLQFRGPECGEKGMCVALSFPWEDLELNSRFSAAIISDKRPGQSGLGAKEGRMHFIEAK